MGGNPDSPFSGPGSPLPLLPPQAPELPPQGDASLQPRAGENDQSPPLPEAVGEHGHTLCEALLTKREKTDLLFRYVTQLCALANN